MLDIYIDEKKHPLPWATDQKADWHWRFNSSVALRTANERDGAPPPQTSSFNIIEKIKASPNGRKTRPSIPSSERSGTNTSTIMSVAKTMLFRTSALAL